MILESGRFVVGVGDSRADGDPAGPNGGIAAEDVQSSTAEAEMFDEMKDFRRFFGTSIFGLFADDQIDVYVGVNKVAVRRTPHGSLVARKAL